MILRLTAQLGKKIGITPSRVLPMDTNPYTDWTAHLFRADRTQYILLANTTSLYSVVLYGRGITNFSDFMNSAIFSIIDTLRNDGFVFIAEQLMAPNTCKAFISKSLSRTVTGSINDLVSQSKYYLEGGDLSPYHLSQKINELPFSYIDYTSPREAFSKLRIP